MKLHLAIEELHRSEKHLVHVLLGMSDRHKAEHEVFHVTRDLARWSTDHVRDLAAIGQLYGLDLDQETGGEPGALERLQQAASDLFGRRPESGLLLLADLRHLYREASGVSLDWELLAQVAQGARKQDLLKLAERCHPETLRQARWANGKLKEAATQALVS
ncbi:hypothetical protein DQ237_19230 [Blastococcus sp. TF02-8]|uniref:hypothetical protein n=1 Tax=Blastococcus sp. TF02-8 TaxID=2250574 RepID=UPI000DE9B908|nr:hypothetical protein [Blastococcus sp. TF02-8]RBY91945.1 hypothetical protein DQ237_19230 [Blastococcus sp. TF02-8]